tara:strand:+ start:408 stop:2273 length:1866 start_codon:yes stop_codon:yes gene_type:complete
MSNVKFQYLFQIDDKGSIKQTSLKFLHLEKRLGLLARAQKRLRKAIKQTAIEQKKQDHHTRNLHGTFSVFRSKLLLAAFAVNLYGRSIGKAVTASQNQLVAEKRLQTAIISTGREAQFSSKILASYASAQQSVTGVGDEAIIGAQALLLTFTKIGKDVFPDATQAILNVSAAMGQDLQQTTIQVGKALNDPIQGMSALRRVGIQLSKTQQRQVKRFVAINEIAKAQKIIIGELTTQFGGMAVAMGSTGAGAFNKLKASAGDLLEQIGQKLSPTIERFAGFLTKTATEMKDPAEQYIIALTKMGVSEEFMRGEQEKLALARLNTVGQETMLVNELVTENTDLQLLMQKLNFQMGENNSKIKDGAKALEGHVLNTQKAGVSTKEFVEDLNSSTLTITSRVKAQAESNERLKDENMRINEVMEALRAYIILVGEAGTSGEAVEKLTVQLGSAISDTFALMFSPDLTGGEKIREFIVQILTLFQGVILSSRQVNQSLKYMFDPITGGARIIGALLLLQAAKAAVNKVKFAATGMDEIVNEPTMIIAGEAGAERVNITPLSGNPSARQASQVNITPLGEGSSARQVNGGGGITVNISGGIVQDDYVRNQLIPALNKATGTGTKINA